MVAPVLVAVVLAVSLQGCDQGPEWLFYATNESDQSVILNSDISSTVVLPPRSFLILGGGAGSVTGGWQIEIVDADCVPIEAVTVSDGDQYVVVSRDGHLSHEVDSTLQGQTEATKTTEMPPQTCPLPRERPYLPSPS